MKRHYFLPFVVVTPSKAGESPPRLSWLLLVGLAACSPYNFSNEISGFSTGVNQLADGFTSGYSSLAADRAALVQLDLTDARAKVAMATSCLDIPSSDNQDPCALYRLTGMPPALSGIEQQRDRTTALLKALKDYAQALVAVSNAADRAAYNAAVAQLASTVGAIAKDAGPQGAAASAVAPAAVNLIGWVVGTALDQQRFESLKAGVTAVSTPFPNQTQCLVGKNTPIDCVATEAGAGLFALALARREVLVKEINILIKPLGPSLTDAAYRQRFSNAQTAVSVLDGLRQADPTAAAAGLVKAHAALVAAVNDPARDYPSLVKAVSDFANQAVALHSALTATSAPTTPPTK